MIIYFNGHRATMSAEEKSKMMQEAEILLDEKPEVTEAWAYINEGEAGVGILGTETGYGVMPLFWTQKHFNERNRKWALEIQKTTKDKISLVHFKIDSVEELFPESSHQALRLLEDESAKQSN